MRGEPEGSCQGFDSPRHQSVGEKITVRRNEKTKPVGEKDIRPERAKENQNNLFTTSQKTIAAPAEEKGIG